MSIVDIVAATVGFIVIATVLWNLRGYKNHGENSGTPEIPGGVDGDVTD